MGFRKSDYMEPWVTLELGYLANVNLGNLENIEPREPRYMDPKKPGVHETESLMDVKHRKHDRLGSKKPWIITHRKPGTHWTRESCEYGKNDT